jgi:hypothetical protein
VIVVDKQRRVVRDRLENPPAKCKIEHRLFSHISMNWRGRPLETYETVVNLIGNTTTRKGLKVKARLDKHKYPTGVRVPRAEMDALNIHRNDFRGEWNYTLQPRTIA